jgi:hypothetical protein
MVKCPYMKDDITYERLDERNYQRIITSLESGLARLKGELLPATPATPKERDEQRTVWLELDRVSRYLAQLREKALDFVTRP